MANSFFRICIFTAILVIELLGKVHKGKCPEFTDAKLVNFTDISGKWYVIQKFPAWHERAMKSCLELTFVEKSDSKTNFGE